MRGLTELGLSKKNLTAVRGLLSKPRGIVLVTGPLGAGKTTTMYAVLAELADGDKAVLTFEERVEAAIPMVRQTQIRPDAGFTLGTAIRSQLRQDPDVIMISDIGDPDTAQLALRAAVSGALVFSALPTYDTADAVPMLMEMGLEPFLLSTAIVGVIAQRLLQTTCADCKVPTDYPPETLEQVGLTPDPDLVFYKGIGCEACAGTGYRGHTGAFEVLTVDAAIGAMIRDRADANQIKQAAVAAGMNTLLGDALSKAIFGHTTIEEVIRAAS